MRYRKITHEVLLVMNKFFEFLSVGLSTPIIYLIYATIAVLFTFILGFPIAIGIYLIRLAMDFLFKGGGIFYASL